MFKIDRGSDEKTLFLTLKLVAGWEIGNDPTFYWVDFGRFIHGLVIFVANLTTDGMIDHRVGSQIKDYHGLGAIYSSVVEAF